MTIVYPPSDDMVAFVRNAPIASLIMCLVDHQSHRIHFYEMMIPYAFSSFAFCLIMVLIGTRSLHKPIPALMAGCSYYDPNHILAQ